MISLRQRCPRCGTPVPFKKTQMGLGKEFECRNCGAKLMIQRNFWIPLLALFAFFRLKSYTETTVEMALLLLGLAVLVYVLSVIFMQPKLRD